MIYAADPNVKLAELKWTENFYRYFIPVRVNDRFTLVACWACNPYVRQFIDYIRDIKPLLSNDVVLFGDLNSNVVFDNPRSKSGKTHAGLVQEMKTMGFEDIYHNKTGDLQGKEKAPTFFLYRHLDKPYHIDHCFAHPDTIEHIKVYTQWKWLSLSDHLPVEITINDSQLI